MVRATVQWRCPPACACASLTEALGTAGVPPEAGRDSSPGGRKVGAAGNRARCPRRAGRRWHGMAQWLPLRIPQLIEKWGVAAPAREQRGNGERADVGEKEMRQQGHRGRSTPNPCTLRALSCRDAVQPALALRFKTKDLSMERFRGCSGARPVNRSFAPRLRRIGDWIFAPRRTKGAASAGQATHSGRGALREIHMGSAHTGAAAGRSARFQLPRGRTGKE